MNLNVCGGLSPVEVTEDQLKRLVLIDEEEAEFIEEAIDTWRTVHAGDLTETAYAKRGLAFDVKRYLNHRYTAAEIEEIAGLSLALFG